jgi:hypothetical protein
LHPKFQEEFDSKRRTLILDSPFVGYHLKCEPANSPALLEAYLNYADWAQRLNYVSYRTSTLPNPRLAVNERLRHWGMLPVDVKLQVKLENGAHMQAEHKFTWALDGDNRKAISHWDKMSTARDVKRVSPDEFFKPLVKQAVKQAKNRR